MQRGVLSFTKEEAQTLSQLINFNENAPQLLQQKFALLIENTADYELSAEDINWLLDQLPTPQEATQIQTNIRQKLRAFLTKDCS